MSASISRKYPKTYSKNLAKKLSFLPSLKWIHDDKFADDALLIDDKFADALLIDDKFADDALLIDDKFADDVLLIDVKFDDDALLIDDNWWCSFNCMMINLHTSTLKKIWVS